MILDFFPDNSHIAVYVDGVKFYRWDNLSISSSMSRITRSLSLSMTTDDTKTEIVDIGEGSSIQVYLTTPAKLSDKYVEIQYTGTPKSEQQVQVFNGWVTAFSENITDSGYQLSLTASDLTIDLVQCSAIIPNNFWESVTLSRIAEDLCKPFDIYVTGDAADFQRFPVGGRIDVETLKEELYEKKFENFSVEPGETAFSVLSRACRARGVLALSNQFGNLVLDTAHVNSHREATLEVGKNIYSLTRSRSNNNTFSEYTCFGQKTSGGKTWSSANNTLKASSKDENVGRYRPLLMRIETDSTKDVIQNRANFEAQIRSGRSEKFNVSVPGWTTNMGVASSNQRPFTINTIVDLVVDSWGIRDSFMVEDVTLTVSNSGLTTDLSLIDPKTYQNAPGSVVYKKKKRKKKKKVAAR